MSELQHIGPSGVIDHVQLGLTGPYGVDAYQYTSVLTHPDRTRVYVLATVYHAIPTHVLFGPLEWTFLDSFSRTLLDTYNPVTGVASPGGWGQGEGTLWNSFTFLKNAHYNVKGGRGRLEAISARYVMVYEDADRLETTTIPALPHGVPKTEILSKFQIQPMERLAGTTVTGTTANAPRTWTNPGYAADGDIATTAQSLAFVATGDVSASISTAPTSGGAVTATVLSGSLNQFDGVNEANGWFNSNGWGFISWDHRYAGGTNAKQVDQRDWHFTDTGIGLHYTPELDVTEVWYVVADERTGAAWDNPVNAGMQGAGGWTIERPLGGGAYTLSTWTVNDGSYSPNNSSLRTAATLTILPGVDYWVRWSRPSTGESRVRIWAVGDAEPVEWQATATDPNPGHYRSRIVGDGLSIYANVFEFHQYAFAIDDISVAGAQYGLVPNYPKWRMEEWDGLALGYRRTIISADNFDGLIPGEVCVDASNGNVYIHGLNAIGRYGEVQGFTSDGGHLWTTSTPIADDTTQMVAKDGLVYVAGLLLPGFTLPALIVLDGLTGNIVSPLRTWGLDATRGTDVHALAVGGGGIAGPRATGHGG